MGRATDADFTPCIQHQQRVPGTNGDFASTSHIGGGGVSLESGGGCRCYLEVIAFNSANNGGKTLGGNASVAQKQNREEGQRSGGENLAPRSLLVL